MGFNRRRRLGAISLAAATMLSAPAAFAQEAEPAAGTGDIIVTANRRAENVQDVAVAVSVVGDELLKANNITNTENLGQVVPR